MLAENLPEALTFDDVLLVPAYSEVLFKLQRVMAPFENDEGLRAQIEAVNTALEAAHEALNRVVPADPNKQNAAPDSVYFGVEDKFSTLNVTLPPQNVSHSELI